MSYSLYGCFIQGTMQAASVSISRMINCGFVALLQCVRTLACHCHVLVTVNASCFMQFTQ